MATFFIFPFVHKPSKPDSKSVEINEKTQALGPSSSSFGWTEAAAPALEGRGNCRKLATHGAHAELGGEEPEFREADCH